MTDQTKTLRGELAELSREWHRYLVPGDDPDGRATVLEGCVNQVDALLARNPIEAERDAALVALRGTDPFVYGERTDTGLLALGQRLIEKDERIAALESQLSQARLAEHLISCHHCRRIQQPRMEGPVRVACGRREDLESQLAEAQARIKELEG